MLTFMNDVSKAYLCTAYVFILCFLQLIDPNLMRSFNISCEFIQNSSPVPSNCLDIAVGTPSIKEYTVLLPYNSGLLGAKTTFRFMYSYHLCSTN